MDEGKRDADGAITAAMSPLGELQSLVARLPDGRVSIGDVVDGLGARAIPLALLLFALPNCIPAPPGIGSILGVPMIALGLCLLRDRPIWLPRFITARSVERRDLLRVLDTARNRFRRVEGWLRPRLTPLTHGHGRRLVGGKMILLAATIALPIPLTNMLPAIGAALMAAGLVAHDGVTVAVGALVGLAGFVVAMSAAISLVAAPLLLLL